MRLGDAVRRLRSPAFSPDWSGTAAVECDRLSYSFGSHRAVDGISLRVEQGEIFGLLGPNGAGKTTTIRVLNTLLGTPPATARILGVDVAVSPMTVRRLIGYVPQQLSADGTLTGRENLTLFARLYDVPRSERQDLVEETLMMMGIHEARDRLVKTYSGGMVRRLELAQALVNRPRLLILDEPTIGLDPIARSGVWERLEHLRERTRMTVLLTTHYMDEADQLCDRVALMHLGSIRAEGTPSELKERLGPGKTLEDVFRHYAGEDLEEGGGFRGVRSTRRTAGRLG